MINTSEMAVQLSPRTLIERQIFQRLLNSFTNATKLNSTITDVQGNSLLSSAKGDCEFCSIIKSTPEGLARCREAYARAGEQASKWKEPYIFKCYAGLISFVCPLFWGGNHVFNFCCGQALMWEPDDLFTNNVKELAKTLGGDDTLFIKTLSKLEVVSSEQVQATADLLLIITSYITHSGTGVLDYQQKLRAVGSWLWVENKKQKISNQNKTAGDLDYLDDDLEQQIFNEIRKADTDAAKRLLEKLTIQFFVKSKGKLEIIKGLSLEFISILARVATECGVKFDDLMEQSVPRLKELGDADTVEKAVLWLMAIGNSYIDLVSDKIRNEGDSLLAKVIAYIDKNYASEDLSIAEVAKACYITPGYLGRVFKKEKNYPLTEHINRVRIEHSKVLLRETDQTIQEIAKAVGFKDRSYFCRVFKQIMGLSPNEFRRK